jgi:hypothetical protein
MSNQPSGSSSPAAPSSAASGGTGAAGIPELSSTPPAPVQKQPISQGKKANWRARMPLWIQQLPKLRFNAPDPSFQLIDPARLKEYLDHADPNTAAHIRENMDILERDLLPFFRDHDYEASRRQNQYRLFQLGFILLATLATLIGSLQALSFNGSPSSVPFWSFLETVIALLATFLATVAGREPPLPLWLTNRRRAESLRREYFRFLMDLPPYDKLESYHREQLLAHRAADINRGQFPNESVD